MTSLRYSLGLKKGGVISLVGAGGKTALMFRLARELAGQGDRVLTTTTTKIRVPMQRQSPLVIASDSVDCLLKRAHVILQHFAHVTAGRRILHFQHKLQGFYPQEIDRIWQSAAFNWIIVEADGAAGKPIKAPAAHEPVIPDSAHWMIATVGLSAVGRPLNTQWAFRPHLVSALTGLAPEDKISASAIAKMCLDYNGMLKNVPKQARRFIFLNQVDLPGCRAAGKQIAQLLTTYGRTSLNGVLIGQTLHEPIVAKYYVIN
ncbi:MAG: selenium cofactor biosynthesis protein YqeC [Desulfobacterales bacterium]|jgi:probable selenium-dependent hydroxylase accessory protein YqeC